MNVFMGIRPTLSFTNERVRSVGEALDAEPMPRSAPVPAKTTDLYIQAGMARTVALDSCIRLRIPYVIVENPPWVLPGFKKQEWYTLTYNGHAGGGWRPPAGPEARACPRLRPWRDWRDGRITIFGQLPNDRSLRGLDMHRWLLDMESVLPGAYVRQHPWMYSSWEEQPETLEECLSRTTLAVTWTSTVGVDCVIRGIPTVALHHGSECCPVASRSISQAPLTPPREDWLHQLSWACWHLDEGPQAAQWLLSGYSEASEQAAYGIIDDHGPLVGR